jgi:drug/metabolite transporter (DMT)-like permease
MNQKTENNIHVNPFAQLAAILVVMLVWIGGGIGLEKLGVFQEDPFFPWLVCSALLLFFAIFNCAFSLNSPDVNKYWLHSIIAYVLLAIGSSLFAWLITGKTINEAKSMKWIYFVFTFGYLVFLSIVNLMRIIVYIAKRQDGGLRGER